MNDWELFFDAQPFGPFQDDARFGILCSLFFNANIDPKKTRARQPDDFFPSLRVHRGHDPRVLVETFRAMTLAMGGEIKEG